ncbi:MAG: epimerase [Microbacteriaceae bacterium]|nr:epimerase [Burkholderiaceae bacterium]
MNPRDLPLLRASLVFVWLATSVASLLELNGQSRALLLAAGLEREWLIDGLIVGGALVDALLGLALWCWPSQRVYRLALLMMLLMTVLATTLLPKLWLDPLGPLTKNLPIAALLWVLGRRA